VKRGKKISLKGKTIDEVKARNEGVRGGLEKKIGQRNSEEGEGSARSGNQRLRLEKGTKRVKKKENRRSKTKTVTFIAGGKKFVPES